eukprot:10553154-Alexandrium_andersonii.AAC.1
MPSLGGAALSPLAGSAGGATSVGGNPRPCLRTPQVRSATLLWQLLTLSPSLALVSRTAFISASMGEDARLRAGGRAAWGRSFGRSWRVAGSGLAVSGG